MNTNNFLFLRCASRVHARRGFTIVEIVIAMGVFATLMSIVAGSLAVALRTQRQAAALLAANSSVSLTIEQISRELRTGSDVCNFSTLLFPGEFGLSDCTNALVFRNARGSDVAYRFQGNTIERREIKRTSPSPEDSGWVVMTAENVFVDYFLFRVIGVDPFDPGLPGYTPRITISLGISPAESSLRGSAIINIQTTISARVLL